MKAVIFSYILILSSCLRGELIEIISSFYTEDNLQEACFREIRKDFEVRFVDLNYPENKITTDFDKVKKYIIFCGHDDLAQLDNCPPEKKVFIGMEPPRDKSSSFDKEKMASILSKKFSRLYTWDETLVDGEFFYQYWFPDLMPMIDPLPSFEEKKFCTMVVRNWHATHRGILVEFFHAKPKGELEFYGSPYPEYKYNRNYCGRIPGKNCGEEKLSVLKNYRFCICFENTTNLKGYISEKIFACFAAGCIPIYWGATNVEDYIPKECFIDYRDFENNEELYQNLKNMQKEDYEVYVNNIRSFLASEKAQIFSPEYFGHLLYEAITH